MRNVLPIGLIGIALLVGACQSSHANRRGPQTPSRATAARTIAVGCATCIFDMKGVSGCKLAVKIEGKPYLVSGVAMDHLGDAHASDGLCNTERKGTAVGKVEGDRFIADRIELLPHN